MADIHVHLNSLQNLFESLDPAPFRNKALDRDAEAYLVEAAGELPAGETLRLVVQGRNPSSRAFPTSVRRSAPTSTWPSVGSCVRAAFAGGSAAGLWSWGCAYSPVLLANLALTGVGPGAEILGEGLLIVGWVGLWRPAEILLFDWLESNAERAVLRRWRG